jgi:hypothetical protein
MNDSLAEQMKLLLYPQEYLRKTATNQNYLRFEVPMAATTKITDVCDVTPCSFIKRHKRIGGNRYLHLQV